MNFYEKTPAGGALFKFGLNYFIVMILNDAMHCQAMKGIYYNILLYRIASRTYICLRFPSWRSNDRVIDIKSWAKKWTLC